MLEQSQIIIQIFLYIGYSDESHEIMSKIIIDTKYVVCQTEVMPSLLVAAIDFGTTFFGYAFSFLHEYQKDPLKISTPSWTAGSGGLVSLKTSTCVLFDSKQTFHSFGYEAEEKYSNLALDDKHHDWYYFSRFKMMLYNKKVYYYSYH